MSKNVELKRLLETLESLKTSIRDTEEPSVSQELENAIQQIELLIKDEDDEASTKALKIIGLFLDSCSSIISIITDLSGG